MPDEKSSDQNPEASNPQPTKPVLIDLDISKLPKPSDNLMEILKGGISYSNPKEDNN